MKNAVFLFAILSMTLFACSSSSDSAPASCDSKLEPGCINVVCVDGKWVCPGNEAGVPDGSQEASAACDEDAGSKPNCIDVVCIEGKWTCPQAEAGPDSSECLSDMPVCYSPVCENGKWKCPCLGIEVPACKSAPPVCINDSQWVCVEDCNIKDLPNCVGPICSTGQWICPVECWDAGAAPICPDAGTPQCFEGSWVCPGLGG